MFTPSCRILNLSTSCQQRKWDSTINPCNDELEIEHSGKTFTKTSTDEVADDIRTMSSTQAGLCGILATDRQFILDTTSLRLSNYNRSNGTVVDISCYFSSLQVDGNSRVKCVNGSWQPTPPTHCIPKPKPSSTTPSYNNNTEPNSGVSNMGSYDTVVIITSCMLGVVVLFLLALLLYKCCISRSKPSSNTYELPRSTSSTLPLYTTQTGSHVLQSSFPGSQQSWTYLSVDRLIRDIEKSRKENPNHNWRDFATISTYSTKRL